MTDIKLGQSINGSLTATDPKLNQRYRGTDYSSYYDEYDLPGLDDFRQLKIEAKGLDRGYLELIDAATGAVVDSTNNFTGGRIEVIRTTLVVKQPRSLLRVPMLIT
jgi:hypothetical protein